MAAIKIARLLRRRRRRRPIASTSNTASYDNHEKINSWVSFAFGFQCGYEDSLRCYIALLVAYIKRVFIG